MTSMQEPADLDLSDASAQLRAGRLSSVELTESCLVRIEERDPSYGAWNRVYRERALADARDADERRADGSELPLLGVPVGLKDVIGVEGLPLTANSAILAGAVASEDAVVWSRLKSAGMILLGHLSCGEFANGVQGVNPWDGSVSPGGSSSGSGIALAARTVPATLGTDARGSIRIPAAFTGVTGLKPSFGAISTRGCIPISFSYDTLGPMARSALDCAHLMTAIDHDGTVGPYPSAARAGERPLARHRIGIPQIRKQPMSDGVATVFEAFQETLASLGAALVPIPWPDNPLQGADGFLGDWFQILGGEAEVIHEQFVGVEDLYGDDFRTFIESSRAAGSRLEYLKAQIKRTEFLERWHGIFVEFELTAVAHPLSQVEPFRVDAPMDATTFAPVMAAVWNDVNFPALSIPAGLSHADGTPVGIQLAGLPFSDARLLQIAIDYQEHTEHHRALPPGLDGRKVVDQPVPLVPAAAARSYRAVANPFATLTPAARL